VDVIREDVAGIRGTAQDPIIGDPIGVAGLRAHLAHEMIPYTAEELIAIGYAELAWCEEQLLIASREMGYGDDWRGAQEAVKELAVPPGGKPEVIRQLADQSLAFVEETGSITLSPLAAEIWRMQMMSPERQLINPFFTGGEVLSVSYPTNTMEHDLKLMSMRGNNPHFNRATVHHELIPGHHFQGFMTDRFNSHRSMFRTPFWGEGWAVYWEMLLWDADFPRGPEDKIGMLFWRMHRAARIIFSLSFHLEQMTPQEAIDFLVERVGHEYANAEAEVRRSFQSTYSPLYQVGYMMGALQFRALYGELVDSGEMTAREYHDAVLLGGRMPVEMVRARLTGQPIALPPGVGGSFVVLLEEAGRVQVVVRKLEGLARLFVEAERHAAVPVGRLDVEQPFHEEVVATLPNLTSDSVPTAGAHIEVELLVRVDERVDQLHRG
jgi:hypothetical protein